MLPRRWGAFARRSWFFLARTATFSLPSLKRFCSVELLCRRASPRSLAKILVLVCLSLPATSSVVAQEVAGSDAELRAAADLLFKRMLVKPDDLDTAFRYSQIETKLGDYEAAIGALERMLFYNSNLPRVKLELGVLYFRLGSYDLAKGYFEDAIRGGDVPPEVKAQVAVYLTEINRRLSPYEYALF